MIPQDLDAEAEVLGSVMTERPSRDRLMSMLITDDFHKPAHQEVFKGLLGASIDGEPADIGLLSARCGVARKDLLTLRGQGSITSWVEKARRVADLGARRRALAELDRARDLVVDPRVELSETLASAARIGEIAPVEQTQVDDIVDLREGEHGEFVIPGILRRRERVVITGGEGSGKSHLGRWTAMAVAAGRAPFQLETSVPSLPTLVVDMENESYEVGASARALAGPLGYTGGCRAISRTQGIDLTQARDVRWLTSVLEGERPALVVIGPLYKMYRGAEGRGKASEEAAEIVANALDELRVAFDCALWVEAHAPHGEGGSRDGGRPRGSALWMGWPHFGLYLERQKHDKELARLKPWRGPRMRERAWPWALREVSADKPWVPVARPA